MISDIFHHGLEGLIAIGLVLLGLAGLAIIIYMIYSLGIQIHLLVKHHVKIADLIYYCLASIGGIIIGYILIIASIVIIVNRYCGGL